MNEEIELILYKLEQNYKCDKEQYFILYKSDIKQILDYITNLQQENEKLKEENRSYQEYPFIIVEKNGVICRKNQEINRLNNILNECADEILKELQENHHLSYGVSLAIRQKLINYRELKESDNNDK